jgi:hypothetical protein
VLAPGVVACTQFILLVLAVAFAIVITAVLLRTLQPRAPSKCRDVHRLMA